MKGKKDNMNQEELRKTLKYKGGNKCKFCGDKFGLQTTTEEISGIGKFCEGCIERWEESLKKIK